MNNRGSLHLLAEAYRQVQINQTHHLMDEGWVDPKTGKFVAPGTPGAVERKSGVPLSQTPNAIKKRAGRAAASGNTQPVDPVNPADPAAPAATVSLPNDIKAQLDKLNDQQKQQLLQLLAA